MLDDQSDMPFRFCHNQNGIQSVMPEYYKLTDKMKTELHLSEVQAQGAIISVANILFGRQEFGEWKIYEKGKEVDYKTLPAPKNIDKTKPYFETIILAGIATEIMSPKSETTITYANNGSSKIGVGNSLFNHSLLIENRGPFLHYQFLQSLYKALTS